MSGWCKAMFDQSMFERERENRETAQASCKEGRVARLSKLSEGEGEFANVKKRSSSWNSGWRGGAIVLEGASEAAGRPRPAELAESVRRSIWPLLLLLPRRGTWKWGDVKKLEVWHAKMISANTKEMVTAMRSVFIFMTLLYFFFLTTWWVPHFQRRNFFLLRFCLFLFFLKKSLHCSVFLSSVKSTTGQTRKDDRIYPENFTRILDRLLDGYDNRLRPGFGGTVQLF